MTRAAVLIGVEKTGQLPKLKVACEGAARMAKWAESQGFVTRLITDDRGPVDVSDVRKAITTMINRGDVHQLLIYFAGHGVNIRYSEFWLLSGAPVDGGQAVNVAAAEALARRGTIPHVVMLADTCRTAAEGIQWQSIDGNAVFPNLEADGDEKAVDLFFAAALGAPSREVRDPNAASARYCAIYTDELLTALKGKYPSALERDDYSALVLRPRPLGRLLHDVVPRRVDQRPYARITSDEDAWLARFSGTYDVDTDLETTLLPAPARSIEITPVALPPVRHFGPRKFETRCGIKVRGAAIRSLWCPSADIERKTDQAAYVYIGDAPAVNLLIEFDDRRAVALPVIREFIAALTFEEGELRNVEYEPSLDTSRSEDYEPLREDFAAVRAYLVESAHASGFRPFPEAVKNAIRAPYLDPSVTLFEAYSATSVREISHLESRMSGNLGIVLFDVAMLAGAPAHEPNIFPFVPMISRGWSLLRALGRDPRLTELTPYVGNSLWTIFDARAVPFLLRRMDKP